MPDDRVTAPDAGFHIHNAKCSPHGRTPENHPIACGLSTEILVTQFLSSSAQGFFRQPAVMPECARIPREACCRAFEKSWREAKKAGQVSLSGLDWLGWRRRPV